MIQQPQTLVYPFAVDGDFVSPPSDGSQTSNFVSQKFGFPQTMSEDVNVPRDQLNGVLNLYSQIIVFLNTGGFYTFDETFANYQKNSVLFYNSENFKGFLISNIDNNNKNFIENPNFIGDDKKPWSKITSYFPDITDVNGEIGFNGNTTTTGNATFNNLINAINANFKNRPFITSLPSEDFYNNDGILIGKTNQVATLGDLNNTSGGSENANTDQGFGAQVTDTGYNSDTPFLKDGGSIGKWCSFDAVFSNFGNSAVCQIVAKCASFSVINGYTTLAGRNEQITNASQYLTSFGLTFGDFFPTPKTFLSTNGVTISYTGKDINLHVSGGNCESLRNTFLSFVNVVISPALLLRQQLASHLIQKFDAEILMLVNKDLNKINFVKNGNLYEYDAVKDESIFINTLQNYNKLGLIKSIEKKEVKSNKKYTKKQINEIKKNLSGI